MSELYISFDASCKVKKSKVGGYFKHTFRKENNIKHSNELIDSSRTKMNVEIQRTRNKSFQETFEEKMSLFEDERRKYNESDRKPGKRARRALNDDSVVLRGLVFQPSPNFFDGLNDSEKKNKMMGFVKEVNNWYMKEFGLSTFIGGSVHFDETNPHYHVAMMPLTQDGRMSQKDFFKNPADLRRMHLSLREHMNEKGFGFEKENKYFEAKRYSEVEFKTGAKEIEKTRRKRSSKNKDLEQREKEILEKEKELEFKEKEFQKREKKIQEDAEYNKINLYKIDKKIRDFREAQKEFERKETLLRKKEYEVDRMIEENDLELDF